MPESEKAKYSEDVLRLIQRGIVSGFIDPPADAPGLDDVNPDFPELAEDPIDPLRAVEVVNAKIEKAIKDGKAEAVVRRFGNLILGALK